MSGRIVAVAAAGLVVTALVWMRAWGRSAASQAPPVRPRPAAAGPAPASAWPAVPPRNPFEYAESPQPGAMEPRPAAPRAPTPPATLAETARPPGGPAVKLIGLLRQGKALKAVLQVQGEVVVVAAGAEAGDYEVLSIDEERGVRLRVRGGGELTLPPPGT
jgi:hypothetical protein